MNDIESAPEHTHRVFDATEFPRVVDWVVQVARREKYEALAGTGHSGLLVIGAACYILRIPAIAVRKDGDPVHAMYLTPVNTILPHADMRYAFVDDMVESGQTMCRVVEQVAARAPDLILAGILLYARGANAPSYLLEEVGSDLDHCHYYQPL